MEMEEQINTKRFFVRMLNSYMYVNRNLLVLVVSLKTVVVFSNSLEEGSQILTVAQEVMHVVFISRGAQRSQQNRLVAGVATKPHKFGAGLATHSESICVVPLSPFLHLLLATRLPSGEKQTKSIQVNETSLREPYGGGRLYGRLGHGYSHDPSISTNIQAPPPGNIASFCGCSRQARWKRKSTT